MEFRILGPLEVAAEGELVELGAAKPRALLGALLLRANEVVASEQLVDALWGETPPPTASKLIQVYISQIRRGLVRAGGDGVVHTRAPGYSASVGVDELDAARFTRLLADARARVEAGAVDEAAELYDVALGLWRGPVLSDLMLEAGARTECGRLEELRLAALAERTECELERGRHDHVISELEALATAYPFHERFWAQLMLAHYRAGRQSDALEAYRRARSALSEQIGLEPTPALRDLERRILNHDPALVPERPATLRRRRRRAAWRRWAAASAAAAIALAGATYALVGRDGSGPPSQLAPNSVGVIDAATGALSGELRLRSRPASLAYGSGSLWVAMQDDHTVLRVDPRTLAVERTIGIGAEPSHVAAASGIVWVLCSRPSRLFEIDGGTGTVVRSIGLAQRIRVGPLKGARLWPPISLAASPGAAWLSGGLGIVVRVDARTARTRQIAATSPEASGPLAYGAGAVWEPSLDGIARIDPRTLAVTTIPAPDVGYPQSVLGVAAAGNTPWVVSGENPVRGQSAWVVDIALRRVTRVIPLAAVPVAATATPGVLWTANGDGSIDRVDARTGEVRQIPVGAFPRTAYPVELAAGGGRVWAAVH